MYVDPSIYENPDDALIEFTSELDPSMIDLETWIGGGNVYKELSDRLC